MKSIIMASAVAVAVLFASPVASEAATNVKIYLGLPHYTVKPGNDYVFRKGYGWYRPAKATSGKISCERAKNRVQNSGYRNVDRVECSGATYTFRGTRNGKRHVVSVDARSGNVSR
jgi:hypothetical protein